METYVGQLQLFAFGYAPDGYECSWLLCDGRTLAINQYVALYSLIGNMYGGNTTAFAIPNLTQAGLYSSPYGKWYIAAMGVYPTRD